MSFQIIVGTRVDAALAEVTVEIAFVFEAFQQFAKVAEVIAQFFRRYGGILPTFPCDLLVRDVRGRSQTRLANFPNHLFLVFVIE